METMMMAGYSRWKNPTTKPVRMEFCMVANAAEKRPDSRMVVIIPPVGSQLTPEQKRLGIHMTDAEGKLTHTLLPRELDAAIHQVRDGVIVGGLAPQLMRLDDDDPPTLAPELDPLEQQRRDAEARAVQALADQQAASSALVMATHQRQQTEREQSKQQDRQDGAGATGGAASAFNAAAVELTVEGLSGLKLEQLQAVAALRGVNVEGLRSKKEVAEAILTDPGKGAQGGA